MIPTFKRIAIVNRGEPAMRLLNAVRELNQAHDWGLRTIALYTDPDRQSLFVRESDEAYCLGEPSFIDPRDEHRKSSYLDYERLDKALRQTGAQAAWVGWGFVAEQAAFVQLCERLGVVFIGPSAEVMRQLGDKIASKRLAEQAGVPVAPWSGGAVESLEQARRHAERLGYPLMIKATAGGGGRGIRKVSSLAQLEQAFESARSEASKAFGDGHLFIEKMIEGARHIEVQVLGDRLGNAWAVGVRDCTTQRRNQKVLEEAPSPVLSPELDAQVRLAATRLSQAAKYQNAGTVEFLFEPQSQRFFFMEMNTRLQVEHPVTELTTGLDLVKLQLQIASGAVLEGEPPPCMGHAIEVRLNAEDPDSQFAPSPGLVELLSLPTGPGLRIDTGVRQGDRVASEFDSMIAKLIAYGKDRSEALGRLKRALTEMAVVVRGGSTNKAFLLELVSHPDIEQSRIDIGWLDRWQAGAQRFSRPQAALALLQAAIDVYEAELSLELGAFFASTARGRPMARTEIGYEAELACGGQRYKIEVRRIGQQHYRLRVDGRELEVRLERHDKYVGWMSCRGQRHRIVSMVDGLEHLVEVDGIPYRLSRDQGGVVRAPSPAVTLAVFVQPGDQVSAGDRLLTLEAMKTEMVINAPCAARVRQVLVVPNLQVQAGTALVLLEPLQDCAQQAQGERIGFAVECAEPAYRPTLPVYEALTELKRLMLGYDIDPKEAKKQLKNFAQMSQAVPPDDEQQWRLEDDVLHIFVDIVSLYHRAAEGMPNGSISAEEYLHTYLRDISTEGKDLPHAFLDKLLRVLRHYGVETLERSSALEQALVCVHKSEQRIEQTLSHMFGVLERRLAHVEQLRSRATPQFRALLDALIDATHTRSLPLNDLAREVRHHFFDRPAFECARAEVYQRLGEGLALLREGRLSGAERAEKMRELVRAPQPLVSYLSGSFLGTDTCARQLSLELTVRRLYRIRPLQNLRVQQSDGHSVASADFVHKGQAGHVVATHALYPDLASALDAVEPVLAGYSYGDDLMLDVYAACLEGGIDLDQAGQAIAQALEKARFSRPPSQICVAVANPKTLTTARYFTYQTGPEGYQELRAHRGIHPMLAERLELWRLTNFNTEPLRTSDDIYLFHAVAKTNPKDERLFAFVEVRDLTAIRDEKGQVVHLPHLERMFLEALDGIREVQARRTPRERLHWNRVILYLWPRTDLSDEEITRLAERLAPATRNLGIEKTVVRLRRIEPHTSGVRDTIIHISNRAETGLYVHFDTPSEQPIRPLTAYAQKVVQMRRLGLVYPYEILRMLTPSLQGDKAEFPTGLFTEYDLDEQNRLVPVQRPPGQNHANVVVGLIRNYTSKVPEGMTRVILLGDGSREMGALAEPECRRIIAALDMAESLGVPLEWFAVSSGAKIAMDVGTEGLDWVARVIRRLVLFTQAGGEVNLIVCGVNVGGQSYWNAEATMLMHTRGILVMTPAGSMVLTGKRALDYSGGVSADDNQGIGGIERIMGFNGQAQYAAKDLAHACQILFHHYEHCYVVPGEKFPRRALSSDRRDRDVGQLPHGSIDGTQFERVGDIFTNEHNPGRKKPFDIRAVMQATIDQDLVPLERWAMMREAENAVVWDAHLGGIPVCLIGIESRPLARLGLVPGDGPDQWTGGTLFPLSSKKVARAINAASANRPVVVLANLSGFDGSPESMRRLQLEYGAEIGRAVVNFQGPMVFCVISRYHGGAYVVFSCALNEELEVAALEGSYASVIGGAPAAAVVFPAEVKAKAIADPRIVALQKELSGASDADKPRLLARYDQLFRSVFLEKQGEVAEEFDRVHSVYRAKDVGSLHQILPPSQLRPYLIGAVERGMLRSFQKPSKQAEPRLTRPPSSPPPRAINTLIDWIEEPLWAELVEPEEGGTSHPRDSSSQ